MVDWVFSTLVADEERAQSNGSVKSIAVQSNGPVKSTAVQSNGPVKSTAVVVMRDMLLGTLEHMDKLTGLGLGLGLAAQGQGLGHGVGQGLGAGLGLVTTAQGSGLEMSSLLRVMLAITQRLLPVPAPLSQTLSVSILEPQINIATNPITTTTNTTNPITNTNNNKPLTIPSLGIGGLNYARTSLMAFHRSLRVLQGQGLGTDTDTKNNNDNNEANENINDNDDNNDDGNDNDVSPSSTPQTPIASTSIALQLLLDILPRACTQLSSPHLPHQILALACVRACFERLALHSPAKVNDVSL